MDQKAINVIRNLALDMISNTGVGHPGITMTSAPILYTLFTKFLKSSSLYCLNPDNSFLILFIIFFSQFSEKYGWFLSRLFFQ